MQEAARIAAMLPTPFQIHVQRKFDEWVTQDRAFARPGIDERSWITNGELSDWKDANRLLYTPYAFHGLVVFDDPHTRTLALRCRRKDLPPIDPLFPKTPELRDKQRNRFMIRDYQIQRRMEHRTQADPVPPAVERLEEPQPAPVTPKHVRKIRTPVVLPDPEVEQTPINPLLTTIDMGPPLKGKYVAKKPRKPKPVADPVPEEPKIIPAIKICEGCLTRGAVPHERFCTVCRKKALAANKANKGWFEEGPIRHYRSQEQKENTFETKYGVDY